MTEPTFQNIIDQLEACDFQCDGGPLRLNVAFIALKEKVQRLALPDLGAEDAEELNAHYTEPEEQTWLDAPGGTPQPLVTHSELNEKIVELLRLRGAETDEDGHTDIVSLYAAQRIEELERQLRKWTEWKPDDEDLADMQAQAKGSNSLAAQGVYIGGLESHVQQTKARIADLETQITALKAELDGHLGCCIAHGRYKATYVPLTDKEQGE